MGIDIIGPKKTCCFDCVYCQLGKTVKKLSSPKRMDSSIKAELKRRLSELEADSIDCITFSGMGEPTLNLGLGTHVREVRKLTDKPIAVLTNSAFIMQDAVRTNLKGVDLVVAKLDAPTQSLFNAINRPVKRIRVDDIIKGLKEFKGNLAIQCMFLESKRFTNTKPDTLRRLRKILVQIGPSEVHVDTPFRPTSESGIRGLPKKKLKMIADFFKQAGLNAVYYQKKHSKKVRWTAPPETTRKVLDLLYRRPCRLGEIALSTGSSLRSIIRIIDKLKKEGKVKDKGNSFLGVV